MAGHTFTMTDCIVAALVVFVGINIICVLSPETIVREAR